MSRRPVFLERRGYRRRRARDGLRMMPVLGLFLFLAPLIWSAADGSGLNTARGGLYLFGVWAGLIAIAAVFGRFIGRGPDDGTGPDG